MGSVSMGSSCVAVELPGCNLTACTLQMSQVLRQSFLFTGSFGCNRCHLTCKYIPRAPQCATQITCGLEQITLDKQSYTSCTTMSQAGITCGLVTS